MILLSGLILPSESASHNAIGMVAAEVFPYFWTLTNTLDSSALMRRRTASIIRRLAWCGMTRSTSSSDQPAISEARTVYSPILTTAFLNTSWPSMTIAIFASEPMNSVPSPVAVSAGAPAPSDPSDMDRMPVSPSVASTMTAPAPSPNNTAVERTSRSRYDVSLSDPMTRSLDAVPVAISPCARERAYTNPVQPALMSVAAALFAPSLVCT